MLTPLASNANQACAIRLDTPTGLFDFMVSGLQSCSVVCALITVIYLHVPKSKGVVE